MNLRCFLKRNFLYSLLIIFTMIFSLKSEAITDPTNPFSSTTYPYVQTNYTNVILNMVNQYTNPTSNSGSESGGGLKKAHYKFIHINPFVKNKNGIYVLSSTQLKKCFTNQWSVSEVSSSSAFYPQISVTNRLVISCLGYEATVVLNGYGQCGFLGLFRTCARITPPCDYGNNFCCPTTVLQDGVLVEIPAEENCSSSSDCPNCALQQDTRICAFEDPMFPVDPTDIKAGSMPFHMETVVPSSIPSGDSLIMLGAFIMAAGLLVPGLGQGTMLIGAGLMLAGGIMELLQFITSKINYVVTTNHGCVDIPLTPSPPPYCQQIPGFIPQATIMSICQQSPEFTNNLLATNYQNYTYAASVSTSLTYPSNTQISTQEMNCEIAKYNGLSLYSTFENPVVRISFDNVIPTCASGYSGKLDVCIFSKSLNNPLSIWYNSNNLLPVCTSAITTNCISFPSGYTPNAKFRPLYNISNTSSLGLSGASTVNVNFSVLSTYPNWLSSIASSLSFSGINYSNFVDVSPGNLVSIIDFTGVTRYFVAFFNEMGDQVCVAERIGNSTQAAYISTGSSADVLPSNNCVPRPAMNSKPTITTCNSTGTNNCSYASSFSTAPCFTSATCPFSGTTNLTTAPRIKFTIGRNQSNANFSSVTKSGIIEVDTALTYGTSGSYLPSHQSPVAVCAVDDVSAYNTTSGVITSTGRNCSVYGYNVFSAYVTDIFNKTEQNLYSTNQSNSPSYTSTTLNSAGAQFVNGSYCRGATKICLDGYSDATKTVVAKVVTTNLYSSSGSTSGAVPTYITSNLTSDRVIPKYDSTNPGATLTSFFDPTTQYQKTSQSPGRVALGTYDSRDKIYIENLYCTEDSNNYCVANGTPTSGVPVSTTCTCVGGGVTKTCTIDGCDIAFLTYGTTNSIEVGKYVSGSYSQNSYCTEGTDYYCQAPCVAAGNCSSPFTPTAATCQCYKNCDKHCKTGTLTSSGYCSVSGCEFAFQPSYSTTITSANYFVSTSGNTYPISGSDACPNYYYTSSGGSTCTGSNCPCYNTRLATPLELGLCASIPQPSCPATNFLSATDTNAGSNGYANWPTTTLGSANINITGTCITGTTQSTNGPPKRSCTYIDTGYEQIKNSSGTIINGCPTYKVGYGTVTNSCIPQPLWWPSQFLVNQDFRGAIFNHFNINYNYRNLVVPTYNNYNQYGKAKEDWVTSNANSCQYNYDYSMNVNRTTKDGDQEMLFITAANWNKFLMDQFDNLQWLFATPTNIPAGSTYNSYNGCYVYQVGQYISATVASSVTVGLKICKYQDYISFSLVDLKANTKTDYTNNAYIMQSNLLDYLDAQSVNNYTITNNSGGKYINHGIVVNRSGFTAGAFASAPPPSGFLPIQTAESVDLIYNFYNDSYSYNQKNGGSHHNHNLCNFNQYKTNNGTNIGCALAMHRAPITYPYPYTSVNKGCSTDSCYQGLNFSSSTGYYIPTAVNFGTANDTYNYGNYYYFAGQKQADHFNGYTCATNITIGNYIAGNSAINPSMFYWTSPTYYSPCHPSYITPHDLTQENTDGDMSYSTCITTYP